MPAAGRRAGGVTLRAGPLEATFLPALGMLGTSLRHRGDELLDLPGGLDGYRAGKVTGLPLLAPWANRLARWSYSVGDVMVDLRGLRLTVDEHGLPVHGPMTARPGWDVLDAAADRLACRFDGAADPAVTAAFPFPHVLEMAVTLSPGALAVATTLRATGDRPVPVAFGYHPYLRLPGVPREDARLALPARDHVLLDDRNLPTGAVEAEPAEEGPIAGRTFDDHYALGDRPGDRRFAVAGSGRRVALEIGDGYRYAQVFAPPGEDHVCLEPMTATVNALVDGGYETVPPGGSFTARFAITVEGDE